MVVFAEASVARDCSRAILNSFMSRIQRYVHLALAWIGVVCSMAGSARPAAPVPVVVLEATLMRHGVGQKAKCLLVRLTEDDTIEWDE
jgi:hypothetical protein